MQRRLYNITGNTTTTLIPSGGSGGSISSISLANASAASVDVDLFLDELKEVVANRAHIVKTNIPAGVTLLLDEMVSFDSSVLSLKITTSNGTLDVAGSPLSIIIR
jgi:hypothetical protein|tara:strand:+ start:517 stop:834 length:318 start_codon:yes stop_codon:yes gene_type:complete